MMKDLWYDIRYGVRLLLKNPGLTAILVLALALGIGANSAIFSVVNALLLRPLPYKDSGRLVWVWETQPQLSQAPFTPADFLDYQSQNKSFEQVATYFTQSLTLTGREEPERLRGSVVSADFFSILGVQPLVGRTLLPQEGQPGAERVAVISQGLWERRFNSDRGVLGKALTLNGTNFTVVGVMPQDFRYPSPATDMWLNPRQVIPERSVGSTDDVRVNRKNHWLPMIARLKSGVSVEQAQADMEAVARQLGQQYNSNHGVKVISLQERIVGDVRPTLLALLGAVGLVLLIACANVANLLLARASSRQREFAIRTAHGASRLRVIRQLLTESILLALLGCGVGLLLAYWGVELLTSALPSDTPRLKEIGLDWRVLVFTLLVSLLTGLAFGLAPALRASAVNLTDSLKEGGRGSSEGFRSNRVRSLLVVSEVALSLVILVTAALLVRSYQRLQVVDPGFETSNMLTLQLSLPVAKYDDDAKQSAFFQQLVQRLEALPQVKAVALANDIPLVGDMQTSAPRIEGRANSTVEGSLAGVHAVSQNYFQVIGTPVLKGRAFTSADTLNSPPVIIINNTMAQRLFPNEEPIGKRIRFSDDAKVPWEEIVGVVGDIKHEGLDAKPFMETYLPFTQSPRSLMAVMIRTTNDPTNLVSAARNSVLEVDRDQPVYDIKTMEQRLSESIAPRRLSMVLFVSFAGLALLLAAVGVYSVISYSVNRRTHEMGIRMALGARALDVLKLVVWQGMTLALVGIVIGVLAAFALTRLMSGLLYGVSATDPFIFAGVALMLVIIALLACLIPARRATKVDPMIALRYE
jgi:putative ABC transport system permease protein